MGTQHQYTANPVRLLFPDVARGFTLLGIAVANGTTAWMGASGAETGKTLGGVYHDSLIDKISIIVGAIFVHVRGLPMFSTMLGMGIGMIVMSLMKRCYPRKKAQLVIVRRYGFLALFGAIHAIFLFFGDIMLFYGLAGMLFAVFILLKDKYLSWIAAGLYGLWLILGLVLFWFIMGEGKQSEAIVGGDFSAPSSYFQQLIHGGTMVLITLPSFWMEFLMLGGPMILGYLAAKREMIYRINHYRKLLWILVAVTVAVMLGVGIPLGLSSCGMISLSPDLWFMLNQVLGPITGPGMIAAIALACAPLQDRMDSTRVSQGKPSLPAALVPIVALGKRSMTGYVSQSILFGIVVSNYGFGLGQNSGAGEASIISVGIWILTVIIAWFLEKWDKPGPFEFVHRRLSYGRKGLLEVWPVPDVAEVPSSEHGPRPLTYPGSAN
ncbi:DUF418 domain-containing protein [Corynebacterium sp. 3HC-13]|uniref:DUF418 domain-containing protein n=1 Tax=Corynebacterium poyangense TaxID=2684405 RepID=UPI001CCB0F08|nr:DUF418 domain-containing protein [Corynebacterium poyangense]MBZ8177930.1 DUF418 domain-containing protein [Corynebacterium poyangense]